MITINDLKNEIARAKRINGFVIIGKTQDKVYVTSNEELQTYQRYNEVIMKFYIIFIRNYYMVRYIF
jgi:hypothetical protein